VEVVKTPNAHVETWHGKGTVAFLPFNDILSHGDGASTRYVKTEK
jgi:hypothetical protein